MTDTTVYIPHMVPDDRILHVEPVGDMRPHDCASRGACWCNPTIEEEDFGWLVVHNALDGREDFETGRRKPS